MDAIIALRLLSEVHREFSQPLHVAFVDLKAAFDSVDRLALWKALRGIGIPQYLLHLIEDLHSGSTSNVRIGSTLSASFTSTSGVRQVCVLAPAVLSCNRLDHGTCCLRSRLLFGQCSFHRSGLYRWRCPPWSRHGWPSYRPRGLLGNSVTTWPGLHVSWQKTKIQNLGAGGSTSNLLVCGQSVEEVAEFTYLGSVQSTTGRCQPDILRRIDNCIHCHAVYEQSLATISASTADETPIQWWANPNHYLI